MPSPEGGEECRLLEALGNLGDFVGGIAVVVTLLYLAAQIRHNTRVVGAASRQEVVESARAWNRLLLDPEVEAAYSRGLTSYAELDDVELARFHAVMHDLALFVQGIFATWENRILEDETYEAYLSFFAAHLASPGGARWWEQAKKIYMPRMVRHVGERVARGGLPALPENRHVPAAPG